MNTNKKMHFLCGLPHSGSDILVNLLDQNPLIHLSTNSGIPQILEGLSKLYENEGMEKLFPLMEKSIELSYLNINKSIIIDESLDWCTPMIMDTMKVLLQKNIKIIMTVRHIPDCASSLIINEKPDDMCNFVFTNKSLENLKEAYLKLKFCYTNWPENFMILEYENLLNDPKKEIKKIHEYLNLSDFDYNLSYISEVKKDIINSEDILKYYYNVFCQPEFWNNDERKFKVLDDLDLQKDNGKIGNFEEGWRLSEKLHMERPEDHRAAFNRSWYLLRQGKIREGYQEMNRGILSNAIGTNKPKTRMPEWDGKSKGTILLYCDHGLGDQIHQVRYAKDLAKLGNKVIVCCDQKLASLFVDVEGVSSVIQHGAEGGVYHNYWVFAMMAPNYLKYELKNLSGKTYISKPLCTEKKERKRIGLRWSGQSNFEHSFNRKFSSDFMFDSIRDFDYEFISLQRDEDVDECPWWVEKVELDTWEDTRKAIASCDLVISSCTSVSHLSAAMGVETWVIIPIMPYYLYAIDGEKTPYYDYMTLFRQEKFGEWEAPFNNIKQRLINLESLELRRVA